MTTLCEFMDGPADGNLMEVEDEIYQLYFSAGDGAKHIYLRIAKDKFEHNGTHGMYA